MRKKKPDSKTRKIAAVIFAGALFMTGYLAGRQAETGLSGNENRVNSVRLSHNSGESTSSMLVPAVDDDGMGMTVRLTVHTMNGDGRVSADMGKISWSDAQESVPISSKVASNIAGVNISKYDIIYNIETGSASIEGISAGAALAIVTVASLMGKEIDAHIMITGAINEDGTIGPISHVLAKAKAAKEAGMSTLLVPDGQGTEIIYETRKYCEQAGPAPVCTTEKVPVSVDIAKEIGIEIKEVKNIKEALVYFFGGDNA